MLKGVNKRIIEVNNPGSEYFERAIFFIKPSINEAPAAKLSLSAEELMRKNAHHALRTGGIKPKGGTRGFFAGIIGFLTAAVLGAVFYAVITAILF